MKIGIIGSGVVGQTLGAKLVERGEDVVLGTRSPTQLADKRGMGSSLQDWLQVTRGMPPSLTVCNSDSLGEQIQQAFPEAHVVKTLNTVTAYVMVDPARVAGGSHHLFVSGNDAAAKARVTELLKQWFGWRDVIDLGDITTARGPEMYLPMWIRLWGALGTPMFNIKIVR